jgi:hypothetical protein
VIASSESARTRSPWVSVMTEERCRILARAVVVAGILLRFLYLDADPHYYGWWGYITDEGRWLTHARGLALFRSGITSGWTLHLMLAPLFEAANYLVFESVGVTILTARLFSAACGAGVLIVAWIFLRHVAASPALLVAMVMLAFDRDLLPLSRVAVPEIVVIFVHLVIYTILVSEKLSRWRLVVAGFLEFVAIGMKVTALPVAAVWVAVILLRRREDGADRRGWRDVMAFLGGFTGPLILVAIVAVGCCVNVVQSMRANITTVSSFVGLSSLHRAIAFFFEETLSTSFSLWGLGVWLATVGRLASSTGAVLDARRRRYFATATIWWVGYAVLMLSLNYFPARYKVHVLVPMVVCIAAGLSLLQEAGLSGVKAMVFRRRRGGACLLVAAWLALPAAVILAPGVANLLTVAGVDAWRLRIKILCVAVVLVLATWAVARRWFGGSTVFVFLLFPVVAALGWFALQALSDGGALFWPGKRPGDFVWHWGLMVAVAAAITMAGRITPWIAVSGRSITAGAIAYLLLSLVRILPGYAEPRYTIRDASRDLGQLLAGYSGIVQTSEGEGLFNENHLRYASLNNRTWGSTRPDVIVIESEFKDPGAVLEREYELIRAYLLYVPQEFFRMHPDESAVPSSTQAGRVFRVFKRQSPHEVIEAGPSPVISRPNAGP